VATVCVGAFMGQLDASIVTLSFPTLQRVFHAGVTSVAWVGLTYLLVLVALVPAVGRFSDMAGRKLVYTYGFGVFIAGSALCGLSPSLPALVAFRAFQALGAAMLQANSVAIIYLAMPEESLGRGIGIQGAAQALGLALGPTIGGALLGVGGWRLIFLVNVPVGIGGLVTAWFLIPRSRHLDRRVPFDWTGLIMFVPAVAALLLAISFGETLGWVSAPIVALAAGAAVLGTGFVRRERATGAPMIDLSLFSRKGFSAGTGSGLLSYLVLFGVMFAVPFYLARAAGEPPVRAGLELTVLPAAIGLAAPLAGRLSDRVGARPLTVGGMLLAAAGLLLLGLARGGTAVFLAELAVVGIGIGAFTPSNNSSIMASAPREQSGQAAGVLNMTRGLGTALGLALTALVYRVAGGEGRGGAHVSHAFTASAVFLAAVALLSAAVATGSESSGRSQQRPGEMEAT
jgi:EmrB/QacA subfamily drug resistance transporter